jgi:multidrug resistance efflux pump/predicted esterase
LNTEPTTPGAKDSDPKWPLPKKQLLRRELEADPGQEYSVYVPSTGGREAPLFVAVHGISRNAHEQAKLFCGDCEAYGVVLVAPRFAAERYSNYQRLGWSRGGKRADVALEKMIEEVASLTGASAARVHLFGYDGGARFVHRYAMAHPERVARAVIASAGSYTFPDPKKRFPHGIGPSPEHPTLRFDPNEFLRVPITVLVGKQDDTRKSPRRLERVGRQPSGTPVDNARNWVASMRAAAEACHLESLVSYEEVEGQIQSFKAFMKRGALGDRVFMALFGPPPGNASDAAVPRVKAKRKLRKSERRKSAREVQQPEPEHPTVRAGRVRRIALPTALCAVVVALVAPLGLCAHYRYTHVVSRDALVKGHIAEVGAQVDGVVRSVEVDAGDRVRAGQIVARLEDRQFHARMRRARFQLEKASRELDVERLAIANERRRLGTWLTEVSAGLAAAEAGVQASESRADEAERRLELQQSLAKRGLAAEELVRTAKTEFRTARAMAAATRAEHQAAGAARDSVQVESEGLAVREERIAVLESEIAALRAALAAAEADLEGTMIRAPDDGAVVRRIVEPGGSTVVGQPIISLWADNEIWVEAWIDEEDLADVEVGSSATVTLKPYPDHEFSGVVEMISVSTDFELPETEVPQPRQARMRDTPVVAVRVRLDDPGEHLFPGLSAIVGIRKKAR